MEPRENCVKAHPSVDPYRKYYGPREENGNTDNDWWWVVGEEGEEAMTTSKKSRTTVDLTVDLISYMLFINRIVNSRFVHV